jgi:hypothetical protein
MTFLIAIALVVLCSLLGRRRPYSLPVLGGSAKNLVEARMSAERSLRLDPRQSGIR